MMDKCNQPKVDAQISPAYCYQAKCHLPNAVG
jgi:hypothetical protein